MKNKFLLLLLAGMSVFTACNDDDDKRRHIKGFRVRLAGQLLYHSFRVVHTGVVTF